MAPALLAAALVSFVLLKLFALGHTTGDSNIYYYLASRVADGAVPYRDFFHAHPPLHLLPGALLFAATGGYTLVGGWAIPLLASGVTGAFLYRIGVGLGAGVSRAVGPLACILYLFSFDVLRVSSHYIGANLAAMWVAIALERLSRGRDVQSACAFTAAACTLLSAAPAGLAAALVLLLEDRRRALRFALAGGASFLVIGALTVLVAGAAYVEQVYLFHAMKSSAAGGAAETFGAVLFYDTWLMFGGLAGALCLWMQREGAEEGVGGKGGTGGMSGAGDANGGAVGGDGHLALLAAAVGALASLALLASVPRIFTYYFLPLFVCLAPLAAYSLVSLHAAARSWMIGRDARAVPLALTMLIILVAGHIPHWTGAAPMSPRPDGSQSVAHEWRGSGFGALDRLVRAVFWQPQEALGRRRLAVTHYLWHEADRFEGARALAEQLATRTGESDTLFGDSTSAPLVALLAGRRLTLDEADTNVMRFSRERDAANLIERLEQAPPAMVLARADRGVGAVRLFREWIDRSYRPVYRLPVRRRDAGEAGSQHEYSLYERTERSPLNGGAILHHSQQGNP